MSLRKILFTLAGLTLATSMAVFAGDAKTEVKKDAPKELKNQTNCPVMGGKIDSTAYTDIQGQRVYHCCPMCTAKLKADPDKYFKQAAADGILFQNIQTTCPVSGEKLEEKTVFTDFEGRRVYFCCANCKGKFAKDPQKYLKNLDKPAAAPTDEKKDEKHDEHEGHNHG